MARKNIAPHYTELILITFAFLVRMGGFKINEENS